MATERLNRIAANVHALIQLKKESGFQTRRAVVEVLEGLNSQELIEVSKIVAAMTANQGANENANLTK
jgi:hypothetical protein